MRERCTREGTRKEAFPRKGVRAGNAEVSSVTLAVGRGEDDGKA
jgi:hypothetical protein